ncbi:MAG: DUF327 family protein [bacterium]
MKVDRTSDRELKNQLKRWKKSALKSADNSQIKTEPEDTFGAAVSQKEFDLLDMEVRDLVTEIDKRGQALVDNPTITHARHYKRAIASFLKKTLLLSKKVKKIQGHRNLNLTRALSSAIGDNENNPYEKTYLIVNTIDEKTEKLTEAILNKETERIDLAENVNEIKGLIVDLLSRVKD